MKTIINSMMVLAFVTGCSWFHSATAQSDITLGVRGGFNLHTAFLGGADKDSDEKAGFLPGLHVGGILEIQKDDDFMIQTGLNFMSRGLNFDEYNDGDYEKYSVSYLQIPAVFLLNVNDFWIGAGPYAELAIGGRWDYYGKELLNIGSSDDDDWAPIDLGLAARAFRAVGPIDIGVDIEIGLINTIPRGVVKDGYSYSRRNFTVNIFAAYLFDK